MADGTVIKTGRGAATGLAIFWAAEALLGLFFAGLAIALLPVEKLWLCVFLFLAGIILFLTGAFMTALTRQTLLLKGPAIEMDARGFTDHRISPQKIPWDAMRWGIVPGFRLGGSLAFDLAREFRKTYKPALAMRWQAGLNAALNYPPFIVHTAGTGKTATQLAQAMERFSPKSF